MNQLQRKWQPNLSFDDAHKQILNFLIECRNKNIIGSTNPSLYECYVIESNPSISLATPITEIMTFAKRHGPEMDTAREASIKLMSAAVKAHYFLHKNQKVKHEPYMFFAPDLKNSKNNRYGLIYPLEDHNILVAEWDLKLSSKGEVKHKDATKFPVVLSSDPYKWLTKKKWIELESKIKYNVSDIYKNKNQIDAIHNIEEFNYGFILDYPYEMRQDLYSVGAFFAAGLKKWFLPSGWDEDVVVEYLDFIKNNLPAKI